MVNREPAEIELSGIPDARAQISGFIFALLLMDGNSIIAEVNHAAENLLGTSAKRLVGRHIDEVIAFPASSLSRKLADVDAQLVARDIQMEVGGEKRVVNLTVSPLPTHRGWRVLTLSDAGREDMGESAAAASLGAPAILAHEIKNPLSAIRGAGQLLARKLDGQDQRLTKMISDEVDRIAGLVDRMQELGSKHVEPVAPFNLHQSVRSAMATVRAASKGRVELIEEFDPSLPEVSANRDALEQVLINILSNAVDACENAEQPRIVVRTRFVSGLAANVIRIGRSVKLPIEISISDNGPGLDEGLGDRIFEPFVSSKKNGQGLGLALVKKLVGDMGARVSYRRDDAKGLTFFKIHLARAE